MLQWMFPILHLVSKWFHHVASILPFDKFWWESKLNGIAEERYHGDFWTRWQYLLKVYFATKARIPWYLTERVPNVMWRFTRQMRRNNKIMEIAWWAKSWLILLLWYSWDATKCPSIELFVWSNGPPSGTSRILEQNRSSLVESVFDWIQNTTDS